MFFFVGNLGLKNISNTICFPTPSTWFKLQIIGNIPWGKNKKIKNQWKQNVLKICFKIQITQRITLEVKKKVFLMDI